MMSGDLSCENVSDNNATCVLNSWRNAIRASLFLFVLCIFACSKFNLFRLKITVGLLNFFLVVPPVVKFR